MLENIRGGFAVFSGINQADRFPADIPFTKKFNEFGFALAWSTDDVEI